MACVMKCFPVYEKKCRTKVATEVHEASKEPEKPVEPVEPEKPVESVEHVEPNEPHEVVVDSTPVPLDVVDTTETFASPMSTTPFRSATSLTKMEQAVSAGILEFTRN